MKTGNAQTPRTMSSALAAAMLALLVLAAPRPVEGQITNGVWGPGTTPYGYTLDQWEIIWGRWNYGQTIIAPDVNGNALVNDTVLMPFLNPTGTGQPATTSITLAAGQGFMLPCWGVYGNSYVDGTPNDDFINQSIFATLVISVQMDGLTILSGTNAMQYYSAVRVSPAIPFNYYPYNYIILFQDIGMVHAPLSVGHHVLTVYARNIQALPPNYGGGIFEVNSAWNITVAPPPSLGLLRQGTNLVLSWPQTFNGYAVQATSTFTPSNWAALGLPVQQVGGLNQVSVPLVAGSRFFRLKKN